MSSQLTIAQLRKYIKDTGALNKVFADVEFEDSDFEAAIFWGKEKIMSIPPLIEGFSIMELPLDLQRLGALASLFESAALLSLRNRSNLSETGVPIPVGENADVYERLAEKYEQKYTQKAMEFKIAYNMMSAMNFQASPYSRLDGGDAEGWERS